MAYEKAILQNNSYYMTQYDMNFVTCIYTYKKITMLQKKY